jgi:hypothetical protein
MGRTVVMENKWIIIFSSEDNSLFVKVANTGQIATYKKALDLEDLNQIFGVPIDEEIEDEAAFQLLNDFDPFIEKTSEKRLNEIPKLLENPTTFTINVNGNEINFQAMKVRPEHAKMFFKTYTSGLSLRDILIYKAKSISEKTQNNG